MRNLSPSIEESLGKVIGRVVEARMIGDGRPFILAHFVTNRCNARCASCLWKNNEWEDVPTDEVKQFYSQAKAEGFVALAVTGGAPFLRRDLGEIVRYAKQDLDMATLMINTGWFLEKRMDEVLPYLDIMVVSIDSASPERHDAIRGLNGLYDRLVKGIKLAKERYPHLAIHLNTCVQQGIQDEIDPLIELATELGVQISFDVITEYRQGGDESPFTETSMGLPLPELQEVCARLLALKRGGAPILNSELYFDYFVQGRQGYSCHLPKVVMFVDGRGNLEDCLNLNEPIGNYRETPLGELMERARFKQLRADAERCSSCNSPTMVDCSHLWENPQLAFQAGGIGIGG